MTKRRSSVERKATKITCIQDVIDSEGVIAHYYVRNGNGDVLTQLSKDIYQKYCRDVLYGLTQRWINAETCPSLTTFNVKVHDNTALLPLGDPGDRTDYPIIYADFLVQVYGNYSRDIKALADLYDKLQAPALSLREFKNIHFHPFHQSEFELSEFPAYVVFNIRHRKVRYGGYKQKCSTAYSAWDVNHYPRTINLKKAVKMDALLYKVYKEGSYSDTPWCEARLVRNIITHLNEWKLKRDGDIFDKTEREAVR